MEGRNSTKTDNADKGPVSSFNASMTTFFPHEQTPLPHPVSSHLRDTQHLKVEYMTIIRSPDRTFFKL